jgi:hypothetical protein
VLFISHGQVETEESENWNGKLKRKTEAESGNGKAEIRKWSSTFLVLGATVRACAIRLGIKMPARQEIPSLARPRPEGIRYRQTEAKLAC